MIEGRTYAADSDVTEEELYAHWVENPLATYVATDGDRVLGTFYLKPNQAGGGSHICNCGYVVAEGARGRGVASAMCTHSQSEAVRLGFRGMQFNLVVSTNLAAVRLWHSLGFATVGTIPGAFRDPVNGYVDGYVMFKQLVT